MSQQQRQKNSQHFSWQLAPEMSLPPFKNHKNQQQRSTWEDSKWYHRPPVAVWPRCSLFFKSAHLSDSVFSAWIPYWRSGQGHSIKNWSDLNLSLMSGPARLFLKTINPYLIDPYIFFWRHLFIHLIINWCLIGQISYWQQPLNLSVSVWPVFAYLSNIDVKTWQEMAVGQCALPCTCVFCLCSPEPSTAWRNAKFIRLACPHRLSHIFCRDLEWWAMGHYRRAALIYQSAALGGKIHLEMWLLKLPSAALSSKLPKFSVS